MTEQEAYIFLQNILNGDLSETTIREQLIAMAERGETVDEITGMARAMREHSIPIPVEGPLLDTCGTGGSGLPRLNVSTLAALVVSADGVRVAKHGNKAASGRCGSFDVLEQVGVNINLNAAALQTCLDQTGLGFIYASHFHPAMKSIAPLRQSIPHRTIFNLLGPLLNPAQATLHVMGVSDQRTAQKMAQVLQRLGLQRALVVTGAEGLDEITLSGPTQVIELRDNQLTEATFTPEQFGLQTVPFASIQGGTIDENAALFENILTGTASNPLLHLVALNAGAALYVASHTETVEEGFHCALAHLQSGKAHKQFETYRALSQTFR